jgi:hypothetical protein
MATTEAIAFLGDTIVALLQDGLSRAGLTAHVLLSTLGEFKGFTPPQSAVTIFLYQVTVDSEARNGPTRAPVDVTDKRKPLTVDLRLLITPWTNQAREAYQIIGVIAQVLCDHAVLRSNDLLGGEVWAPDDVVQILSEQLSVQEHSSIWTPSETPYRLSLTYLARLKGITDSQ